MSAQESVARVAAGLAGMPAEPQFRLGEDPLAHPYDLGLRWAKVLVELQSEAWHSSPGAVARDVEHHDEVALHPGWRIVWAMPKEVLPLPDPFVRKLMHVVCAQPGPRSRALRRRWVDERNVVCWPREVRAPRPHRRTAGSAGVGARDE